MEVGQQFLRLTTGESVGWARFGSGQPLFVLGTPITQLADVGATSAMFERLSVRHTVVLIDTWTSLGALEAVPAVAEATELDRVSLYASYRTVPAAIRIAVERADLVDSLVLWSGVASSEAFSDTSRVRALRAFGEADWEAYTEVLGALVVGTDPAQAGFAHEYARWFRGYTSSARLQNTLAQQDLADDVRGLLERVRVPALVVHRRYAAMPPLEFIEELAMSLPDATLRVLEGDGVFPEFGDLDEAVAVIESRSIPVGEPLVPPRLGLQTILFTDLESSTALTQRLGDEGAQELLRDHNNVVRGALESNGGREVKHTGDGIMASFQSAVSAVTAALAIQRELLGTEVRVRLGLNAGEPIEEEDDLFGASVQLAARITGYAQPGQVLVSRVVADLCAGKTFHFASVGEATLKGFDDPVALYEVHPV